MPGIVSSIGLQAVIGAVARTGDAEFDPRQTLTAIAELAQGFAGARGVAVEHVHEDAAVEVLLNVGQIAGAVRRLPITCEGAEIGALAIYGAPMFGPATADRTRVLADLAAIVLTRAARIMERTRPGIEDAKYRLINGVGQNLRNTLGAASGYMQLVEFEGPLTDVQGEYVNRSRRAINAAVSLIDDLLDVTRADAGKLTFDHAPVDVNAIVREAARQHTGAARSKQCDVEIHSEDTDSIVLSDRNYVQQLADVLVYNAVRYTPREGKVTVRVESRVGRRSFDPARWVCLSVTDTGGGVAEAQKVFEELHRVEQAKGNVRFKLAICRRVARLLGGDMTLETEKNVGSTFTLWLPAPATQPIAVEEPVAMLAR
jgi:signal transduction histidine kinase